MSLQQPWCARYDDRENPKGRAMIVPDWLLYAWFALAGLSTLYVVWDNFVGKNPEETVMKWGWLLITLYMRPIGLALYVLSDKEPSPGTHEEFVRPLWKQGVGSTVHCIAGDATGIIAVAAITALLGLPMWIDFSSSTRPASHSASSSSSPFS